MSKKKVCLFCRSNNARQEYLKHKSGAGLATFKQLVKKLEDKLKDDVEYIVQQECHGTSDEMMLLKDIRVMISQAETETYENNKESRLIREVSRKLKELAA